MHGFCLFFLLKKFSLTKSGFLTPKINDNRGDLVSFLGFKQGGKRVASVKLKREKTKVCKRFMGGQRECGAT